MSYLCMQTVELLNNFDMRQQSYQFIVRFIRMMAFSIITQDIERLYYGHMVHCYRRCNIMMQIVVYKTNQREDGILVAFSYFFATNELFFTTSCVKAHPFRGGMIAAATFSGTL